MNGLSTYLGAGRRSGGGHHLDPEPVETAPTLAEVYTGLAPDEHAASSGWPAAAADPSEKDGVSRGRTS